MHRIEQARASLRQEIVRLRQALGRPILPDPGGNLRLSHDALDIDVARFESASADPRRLADAVMLYRGDLLEGIESERDAEPFGEWLAAHRRRLKNVAFRCHNQLLRTPTIVHASDGEATRLAVRAVAIEPACEEAHQRLIRAHAARHDLPGVLEQFGACREALRAQHRMEPSPDTCRLVETFKVTLRAGPALSLNDARTRPDGRTARARKPFASPLPDMHAPARRSKAGRRSRCFLLSTSRPASTTKPWSTA